MKIDRMVHTGKDHFIGFEFSWKKIAYPSFELNLKHLKKIFTFQRIFVGFPNEEKGK